MINLYNKDCLEVLKKIESESVDLVVTDPPYKVTKRGNSGGTGGMLCKDINKKGNVFNHNNITIKQWLPEVYRVLKFNSHCYIMTNNKNLLEYQNEIISQGFDIYKILIWEKGNCITNMYYMDTHEYIIFCRKGKAKKINNCGTKSIIKINNKKTKDANNKNIHDTEKPVELMEILINNSTKENEVVLDLFMGVGASGIACIKNNRNFIGIEIDENYFKIAKDRMEV